MRKKKKLAELGQENDENEDLSTKLEQKKLLHSPSVRLREASENSDEEIIAAARKLFGIDEK